MVTPQYNFVHILKRWTWCIISCPRESTAKEVSYEWSHYRIFSTDSKLHELPYISPQLTLVVSQKGKAAGNTMRKKIHRTRSREALWAIGLLVLVFTILRQNLWGSNKKEWNLIIRLRQIFYCLLQQLSLSLYIFFATGKPETWKESHHERDPSVRDIFPYVACLIIGAGNERRKGILRPSSDAGLLSCRT